MSSPASSAATIGPLNEIVQQLGLQESDVEPFGWYTGKLVRGLQDRLLDRPTGKYVGVTAISPTPLGEGKTVVAIGLAMALVRRGYRSIATLREPSLAPVFGIKGGGAGGGRARLLPAEDINLHFTGDLHAVAAANNLLAAMLDNHCQRALLPQVSTESITWRRVMDMNDKGLSHIETGLTPAPQSPRRHTGFDLTAASEVMSILALATDMSDLRKRLGHIIVARSPSGEFVTAEQIGAAGAMAALLRHALRPNLVQTSERTPALVHSGPFANISHGNSSVIADLTALRLADYVVTESGFGADLGAEKFFNIKCRNIGLRPDAEVLICTLRALKYQSGNYDVRPGRPLPDSLMREDSLALRSGMSNLCGHLAILRKHGVPVVVAINRFPTDTDEELRLLQQLIVEAGVQRVVLTDAFSQGSEGALALADAVVDACADSETEGFRFLYELNLTYEEKISAIAADIYGADGVEFGDGVCELLREFSNQGHHQLPVCIAKTQYSLSHDPRRLGRPAGFVLPIREVRLSAGAGFVLALTDGISLMPGLPRDPAARRIDVNPDGSIVGSGPA